LFQERKYQTDAAASILSEWQQGRSRTLLVLPTGTGKTIVFSKVLEHVVREGKRALVLAHRGELLEQAADKLQKTTGLGCSIEKAESSCREDWFRVTVGSVQTLMRPKRLETFPRDYFDTIIVDEAHHCLADSYQRVLAHFESACVLGVTATPDRGDLRGLGEFFHSLAYEYTLPQAIKDGFLCPIKALTIPLKIDLTGVKTQSGDYQAGSLGAALDPYLHQIANEMDLHCVGRKTVIFLPLIATSQKMRDILAAKGWRVAEVNGESIDRKEILRDFDAGRYQVLCNSMLLTEGWDCPTVNCIVPLRATKIRSLFAQMVGRGTRIHPGKKDLLLLDFLWNTSKHDLCRPAHLLSPSKEVADRMVQRGIDAAGTAVDIMEEERKAESDCVAATEEALAKKLAQMRNRKHKLVDPLQYAMSIQSEDLAAYVPAFGWEAAPPSEKQIAALEKFGINPDTAECAGKASVLLDRLAKRMESGLTTPKQIRFLEGKGFQHVGTWDFDHARRVIDRIAANGWTVPHGIAPATYAPQCAEKGA